MTCFSVLRGRVSLPPWQREVAARPKSISYQQIIRTDKRGQPFEIVRDSGANAPFWKTLDGVIRLICADEKEGALVAREFREMLIRLASNPNFSQKEIEERCGDFFLERIPGYEQKLAILLEGRSAIIFEQIWKYLRGERIIDIGAGDGKVGALIQERLGLQVELADVKDYNTTGLPLRLMQGGALPFADSSFDTAVSSVVYHHADEPLKLIAEERRVLKNKGRLVVIESVYQSEEERKANIVLDWFYNRVLHKDVNCPYNLQAPEGWKRTFGGYGFRLLYEKDLGIDQPLVPEHHWLFILEIEK